jgi:hypothetical protein
MRLLDVRAADPAGNVAFWQVECWLVVGRIIIDVIAFADASQRAVLLNSQMLGW